MNEKFEIMNAAVIGKWKDVNDGAISEFTKDGKVLGASNEEEDYPRTYKFKNENLIVVEQHYTDCSDKTEILIIPVNEDKMFLVVLEAKKFHENVRVK